MSCDYCEFFTAKYFRFPFVATDVTLEDDRWPWTEFWITSLLTFPTGGLVLNMHGDRWAQCNWLVHQWDAMNSQYGMELRWCKKIMKECSILAPPKLAKSWKAVTFDKLHWKRWWSLFKPILAAILPYLFCRLSWLNVCHHFARELPPRTGESSYYSGQFRKIAHSFKDPNFLV